MARKPGTRNVGEFALFDVVYEDGTQRSNRRVPMAVLGGLDEDEPARAVIREQDAEIAQQLYLGEATVKTHVGRVLTKLDLRDRVQAVVAAYESGLVVPGSHDSGG